ncbi:MAG: leucine-rich repeat protein [Oscillospiraceae bacterium]|nr:leucine-rich repeat protein [Oscillospiraceae bacterium]
MKKKTLSIVARTSVICLLVAAVLAGIVSTPNTQVSGYEASYVQLLENAPALDLKDYLDSSVMFALPENIKDDQQIAVIVTVDEVNLMDAYEASNKTMSFKDFALSSEEAADIRAGISRQKEQVLSLLNEKGISYTAGEEYATLLSGFEMEITARDFDEIRQSLKEGQGIIVSEVYNKAETQLVENKVNVYDTGIFNSSGFPYDGSGMVVAVLDTGLDSAHSAFSTDNFTSTHLGLTYDEVASVIDQTTANQMFGSLTVDDVYINEKVPFGYDYADNDPDVYSTHNNHGTHVSGVIVGKDDTITGVAPNAQLVSMKIFSDVMDTARASWILSALEDCVVLGVDVINMSLGTACGFARETDEEIMSGVYDRIREAGISMIVAASNSYSSAYGSEKNGNLGLTSNPDTGTVGSPSTYKGVMSVASINGKETPYLLHGESIIYFIEANSGAAVEQDFVANLLGGEETKEIDYVIIPGVGRSADYTGMDVTGKIVLVRRGSNTFEEKAMIAESKGAAGIIIYNNVSGDIKMNIGDAKLAVCSISQDDGEMLVAAGNGKLTISKDQTSGPFISDFSSWGPTPSLNIKPEITAHGGNILSSVTGGGYDRLSGTSMACPNLAGVVILLRQYVVENFSDIADDNVKVNEMVNKLMMSTADIALNTNGLPYAVRKQGAGLANLFNSLNTTAYITTYDKDGNPMDKPKLELGDDANKTGVYEMTFSIHNFGSAALSYDLGDYILTEGVSETKTNAGETTVTEEAYALGGSIEIVSVSGGTANGKNVTVSAGEAAKVTVKITLTDADKEYLNESFENGMYVEGYITLSATSGTEIDMSVPYLAYYGDWTVAPIFDLEYYETHADELDDSIAIEDKVMADAYASRPIGGVSDDYVSYLGSYYFLQDPDDMVISANKDYIALSNRIGTIHSLRFVWAGLLRNAQRIEITVTDDTTGEVIFETIDYDVRKSYGDGGSIYPANVEIEFDTMDYNMANNTEYTVRLEAYLDYGDGGVETNERNVFEFPLVADFEAPTVTGVEYSYKYDKTLKKNRLYAKVAVYDNHFAMSSQLGYVTMENDADGNPAVVMKSFEQYMTPIYSQRNSTTYVTFELTDYIYDIKNKSMNDNCFVLTCYDYALNYATYEIGLPADYVDFYFDGLDEGLTLSPNEVYSLAPLVHPDTEWAELLEYASSRPSVARIVNDKIVATAPGTTIIRVRDPKTNKSLTFNLTVLSEGDEGFRKYDKPVADVFMLTGYDTQKAYYQINSEDKVLGDTGDTRFFEGNYSLSMYPSESVKLNYKLDAFFPKETTVVFESSNDNIVTINESGIVTAKAEGFASVTLRVLQNDKSTYYSETVSIEVKDPFVTNGASLSHYYGNGGTVSIPEDLSLTEIGSFAFSNFEYVLKTEEELAFDDAETSKQWYIGDNTITKVIIPEGIKKINAYAFANLTALEEIVLPSTMEAIEYGAFYGCTSLQKLTFSGENNLDIISQNAFENCNLQGVIDLSSACVISDYAFAGNKNLEGFVTSNRLLSIGQYAFAGCKKLTDVTIVSDKVKYGTYAFTDCESLTSFYVNASVLPEGMFYECEALESVTIGPDVNDIGPFAFRSTKISSFQVEEGNQAFKVQNANYILSADGSALVTVAPTIVGEFGAANLNGAVVDTIAKGAFSHNIRITAVNLPSVTKVGEYGFGSSTGLKSLNLGVLSQIGDYGFFETGITEMPSVTVDTVLGKYAFSHTALTSVQIPDGVTLPEGIFSECVKLETVVIGDNVTIGDYAFSVDKDNVFDIKNYNEDGEKYFYYVFNSALKNLTIGENAIIGENAFACAASLESVSLGANATIGYMAFYNNSSLKNIDLSKALVIGDYAFSGDVYYVCLDDQMTVAAVSKEGKYIYTYHAPKLTKVDLGAATSVGEYAFSYCRELTDVILNSSITEIPSYAFAGCEALENINLSNIITIGDNAFIEDAALKNLDLSAAESIGEYAFVYCVGLESVKLSENGTDIAEGAFSYCEKLSQVENIQFSEHIDSYAFAYTAITEVDLSCAVTLGDFVFLKENLTPFKVTLGNTIVSLGDNPFALCQLNPFTQKVTTPFNGTDYETEVDTFQLSDSVFVIDGSLYDMTNNGMEMVVYAGNSYENAQVAEDTIRIGAYAFAGSSVRVVSVPYTVKAIGHKAFFGCDQLEAVSLASYDAPILEEEFDSAYYESFQNIPGTGDYGSYNDYDGTEVVINGMGLLPYYMWNATDSMYSNVFYGANFVDYVGKVENKLTLIRPSNGQHYDTFILEQYFDTFIDGAAGADDTTLNAILAIELIPERVTLSDKATVEAARVAYDKIATALQRGLVDNYDILVSAEQRIKALQSVQDPVVDPSEPTDEPSEPSEPSELPSENPTEGSEETPSQNTTNPTSAGQTSVEKKSSGWLVWVVVGLGVLGVAVLVIVGRRGEKK